MSKDDLYSPIDILLENEGISAESGVLTRELVEEAVARLTMSDPEYDIFMKDREHKKKIMSTELGKVLYES